MEKSTFTPDHPASYSDRGLGTETGAWVPTGPPEETGDVGHYAGHTERRALAISSLSVG